jgi:hypothetical protein
VQAWGSPGSVSGLSATTQASTRGPCRPKTDLQDRGGGEGKPPLSRPGSCWTVRTSMKAAASMNTDGALKFGLIWHRSGQVLRQRREQTA